ncbi:MAG: Branched-chain amino acid transporter permease [Chthoniobacteraceae bacterium]|nr:Branched-chain amino acid transporter permease [Chthoniobacteraceae bacterium]MDB6173007.1 Branched-chain amino acid transporter permease [Chthoniobacteraceae bacterium]
MIEFLQQLIDGFSQGAIYALIALGYTMVFGVLRFINFAHGDVFMLGAFAGLYLGPRTLKLFGAGPSYIGAAAVMLLAMLVCAVIGIIIERLCYRPLRERPKLTVLITAIGVSLFLENFGQFIFGANPKSFPELINNRAFELPEWWGQFSALTITISQVLVVAVTLVLLIAMRHIVLHTRMGMAMRALSFNPVAASLMGINTDVVISFTFGLGSALAGAAGILISIQQPSIDPLMGVNAGLKAFVAAVLGGIGNLPGAALGGILIGLLEYIVVGYVSPTYRDAIVFGVLILILLVKPTGLLGSSEREKV